MIRREKTTIYLDVTEETKVYKLKQMLHGIVKKAPEDQKLYKIASNEVLEDDKTLGDSGYKSQTAKAQDPGTIGLAYRTGTLLKKKKKKKKKKKTTKNKKQETIEKKKKKENL